MSDRKSAFIAIVGRPNVGKSSILNKMLGEKIAIVSSKPQTTRTRIMGVLTEENCQLVFIDTPGLHKPRNDLDRFMLRSVNESVAGVDMCVLVVEPDKLAAEEELQLIEKFRALDLPAVLAINKIDTVNDKTRLAKQISELSGLYDFSAVVPCSAQTGSGIDILKKEMRSLAGEGDFLFDEIIDMDATIFCERDSHKGIIIGKGGSMLKKIGSYARQDMERFFGCKVNLQLWVKVKEDWRNREAILRSLGYDQRTFDE